MKNALLTKYAKIAGACLNEEKGAGNKNRNCKRNKLKPNA